jgi:hypothetical protein
MNRVASPCRFGVGRAATCGVPHANAMGRHDRLATLALAARTREPWAGHPLVSELRSIAGAAASGDPLGQEPVGCVAALPAMQTAPR